MHPCNFFRFGSCLIILLCLPTTTGQSNLVCSSQPIIALAGNDVILPCRLDPPISASSRAVEWTKPGLDPEYIHLHQDGRLVYQSQNPLYNYRTALFVDQLINGNVSMKIFRVKTSDAGKYKCFLPSLWKDSFIQLTVGAVSPPIVSLAGIDKSNKATRGVVLQCNSTGWYPEPEVFWLDGEGNLLSAGPTETVRGPDDLYTVSSRVTVEKRHSRVTCRVQQNHINQIRETQIHVPEDFFMAPSSCAGWTIFSGIISFVLIVSGVVLVWKLKPCRNKTDTGLSAQDTEVEKNNKAKSTTAVRSDADGEKEKRKPLLKPSMEQKRETNFQTSNQENQEISASEEVILEVADPDGKFLRLRNKSGKNQLLANCKIEVNRKDMFYSFPKGFILEAGKTVTIWASDGGGNHNPQTDVVWKDQKSWGATNTVLLITAAGEKKGLKLETDKVAC